MSRFLLLFLFLIWMTWRAEGPSPAMPPALNLWLFFGVFGLVVGMMGVWSRLLARRVGRIGFSRAHRYFNRVIFAVRFFVPIWFAVGVFFLNWGDAVTIMLGPVAKWPAQLPGTIIGTLPALLAWAGLWWAQYPADRALHDQHMLIRLDDGQPVYRQPSLWSYVVAHLRLQVLFTAVPILLILLAHDVVVMTLWGAFNINLDQSAWEGLVTFASVLAVFLIAPGILVHVLPTQPLPPSTLRDRMEGMCRAHRLKFRDILLWRTDYRIANALVMGVLPRFRYVLLSDLLLEEMTDEQIEAVFAHELGHAVHRHLIWLLVSFKVVILALMVAATLVIAGQRRGWQLPGWLPLDLVEFMLGLVAFLLAFRYVSQRFERQADVFAARTLERHLGAPIAPEPALVPAGPSHVGPLGASVFASALQKVADINNMPIEPEGRWEGGFARRLAFVMERMGHTANSWLHGSIATRMRTLHSMSADPTHTHHFDRRMSRLYATILGALLVGGVVAWWINLPL